MANQKFIFRANRAGVFFGELASQENTPAGVIVEINNCRRIWYWNGAASLSELAMVGPKKPQDCKFSVVVPSIKVIDVIEIIPCTEDAIKAIEGVKEWKA